MRKSKSRALKSNVRFVTRYYDEALLFRSAKLTFRLQPVRIHAWKINHTRQKITRAHTVLLAHLAHVPRVYSAVTSQGYLFYLILFHYSNWKPKIAPLRRRTSDDRFTAQQLWLHWNKFCNQRCTEIYIQAFSWKYKSTRCRPLKSVVLSKILQFAITKTTEHRVSNRSQSKRLVFTIFFIGGHQLFRPIVIVA